MNFLDGLNEARSEMILITRMITDDLLFNSVTVQLAEMTTEAFFSPLYNHFHQALAVVLNTPKENVVIFSVQVHFVFPSRFALLK